MNKNNCHFFINAYIPPPPLNKNGVLDVEKLDKGYKLLKEANFNHAIGFYEKIDDENKELDEVIKVTNKYEINYIASSSFTGRKYDKEKYINSLKILKKKNIFGISLFDEPGIKEFPVLKEEIELLNKYSSNSFAYYNLIGMDNPSSYLENGMWTKIDENINTSYKEYLDLFINEFKPKYLSYDFYPFFKDIDIKEGYFEQLKIVSDLSKKLNIPFYPYIQSCSWDNNSRIPSYEEILVECGISLCYGAKGLQFFTFFTPYSNNDSRFDVAILDKDFNKTIRYDAVKTFTNFLIRNENDLLNSSFVKTVHIGKDNPLDYEDFHISSDKALVGIYENERETLLFITNIDFKNEIKIKVSNNNIWKLIELNDKITTINNKQEIIINKGESVILKSEVQKC